MASVSGDGAAPSSSLAKVKAIRPAWPARFGCRRRVARASAAPRRLHV